MEFIPNFYTSSEADQLLHELQDLPLHTSLYTPKRKICAFGDGGLAYELLDTFIPVRPWSLLMLQIKEDVQRRISTQFNFILVNYYADGQAGIRMHKDNEYSLCKDFPIACLCFGAKRDVEFHKSGLTPTTIQSSHGSMYILLPPTHKLFTRRMPIQHNVKEARISLTFYHLLKNSTEKQEDCDEIPEDECSCGYAVEYNSNSSYSTFECSEEEDSADDM